MFESVFFENLEAIAKCVKTLEHCAAHDTVAAGFLKNLQPLYHILASANADNTSAPSAKRARVQRDSESGRPFSTPIANNVSFPSNAAMLEHILDLTRRMYGGEDNIVDQDFLTVNRASLPDHYRFMYAQSASTPSANRGGHNPQSSASTGHGSTSPTNDQYHYQTHIQQQHQQQHQHQQQPQQYWHDSSSSSSSSHPYSPTTSNSSGSSVDVSMGNSPEREESAVSPPAAQAKYPRRSREEYEAFFKRVT